MAMMKSKTFRQIQGLPLPPGYEPGALELRRLFQCPTLSTNPEGPPSTSTVTFSKFQEASFSVRTFHLGAYEWRVQ